MSGRWETVTDEDYELTERLAVPGGWLYRTALFDDDGDHSRERLNTAGVALCFVPAAPEPLEEPLEEDGPIAVESVEVGS